MPVCWFPSRCLYSQTPRFSASRSPSPDSKPDPRIAAIERFKEVARHDSAARVPFTDDRSDHHQFFTRAVLNVLSTELALFTFAQIVDGLPTAEVAWDRRYPGIDEDDHPIESHPTLCPGVLKRTSEIRQQLDLSILRFNPALVAAYRSAAPGSQAFNVRLIELVAVAIHQLGAMLFKLDTCMHQGGRQDIDRVTQHQEPPLEPGLVTYRPRVTLFSHHGYLARDVYPEGIADIVGYWTEDRILGGVSVFDRLAEARDPRRPPNVYFHACRDHVTFRYFQLRDEQQQSLVDFFLAEDPSLAHCPLPVIGDKTNLVRVDPHDAVLHRIINRDVWECKPPAEEAIRFMWRVPQGEFDYPEHRAMLDAANKGLQLPSVSQPGSAPSGGYSIGVERTDSGTVRLAVEGASEEGKDGQGCEGLEPGSS